MSFPNAGPQPAGDSSATDAGRVEALDYRTLIDECVKRKDWMKLFRRLRDSKTVSAAAVLVRLRFGLPHLDAVMKDRPMSIRSRFALWDDEDDDLETPPGTAEEIS